jgi:hypothetical protein
MKSENGRMKGDSNGKDEKMKAENGRIKGDLKELTKEFALNMIALYSQLPKRREAQVLGDQLLNYLNWNCWNWGQIGIGVKSLPLTLKGNSKGVGSLSLSAERGVSASPVKVFGFCLMRSHFHFIVEPSIE